MLALISTISAGPVDFDSVLESASCRNGPKMCGFNNFLGIGSKFCGDGKGCYANFGWEFCISVASFQCPDTCEEGQVLNPLRYCECISEDAQYDILCAPDDFEREQAGLGETCGGFDETINGPFPDC